MVSMQCQYLKQSARSFPSVTAVGKYMELLVCGWNKYFGLLEILGYLRLGKNREVKVEGSLDKRSARDAVAG